MTIDVKASSATHGAGGFQTIKMELIVDTDQLLATVTGCLFSPSIIISDVDIDVDNFLMRPHKFPGI